LLACDEVSRTAPGISPGSITWPREWYELVDRTPVHADPHPFAGLDAPEHLGGVIPQIA
jgi:hypothetical protein